MSLFGRPLVDGSAQVESFTPDPERLLDELYACHLGGAPEDFHSGGLVLTAHEPVRCIRYAKGEPLALFSIARPGGGIIAVRPDLYESAEHLLRGRTVLDKAACDAIQNTLYPLVHVEFWFRGTRLYCAPHVFQDGSLEGVCEVTHMDETASALHARWGGPVFGQVIDGRPVSWAAVKPLGGAAWDLSVQTFPGQRGKGYARSAVSAAVKYIFQNGRLATWGTDRDNAASLRTAASVGFQDYGLDFGCVETSPR